MTGRKVYVLLAGMMAASILCAVASIAGAKSVLGFLIAWALIYALFLVALWAGVTGKYDGRVVSRLRSFP